MPVSHQPMSARAATARIAMVVCLLVFVLSSLPFVQSQVFTFSLALACLGLTVGILIPAFDKTGIGAVSDLALGIWVSWMIAPRCQSIMLDSSGSPQKLVLIFWLALFAYTSVVFVVSLALKHSYALRRFSNVCEQKRGG